MTTTQKNIPNGICPNCGGKLDIDQSCENITCPYCGTQFAVDDLLNSSDAVRIEKIKSQTYKEMETKKMEHEIEKEKRNEEKTTIEEFKKSKLRIVSMVFAVISLLMCILAFQNGAILSGIIAIIMTALFIFSFVLGMQIIKEKRKGIHMLAALLAFLLMIPYFALNNPKSSVDENLAEFQWPTSEIAGLLPKPESNIGKISWENSDGLSIDVGETSKQDYDKYVNSCKEKGFTVDYSSTDSAYHADNADGYSLSLYYKDDDEIMSISLNSPEEDTEAQTEAENETEEKTTKKATTTAVTAKKTTKAEKANDVDADFKKAMDSYEDFMDEYVTFMKKYQASNGTDMSLLSDYTKYMSEYADMVDKFDKWEDEDLNDAETAYYIEVQTRVSKKLAEVAQ